MRKRILSLLLCCVMLIGLLPTAAFAEDSAEEPPVCSCETACMAEAMNADCPICGVEGALPENCAKCAQPADDAAVQPEGEVSDPQPETALTALIGGSETVTEVSTADELTAAIADSNVSTVRLAGDISISSSLTVLRKVTLDLNGYVLKMTGSGSVIILDNKSGITGDLTLIDSNPTAEHKFKVNGAEAWVLDDSGTETVYGGIITGGTGSRIFFSNGVGGGGVIIGSGALTMNGGNIVGCIANRGGGLFLSDGSFTMNAGSIVGCSTPNRLTTGEAFHGGIYAFGPMANGDTTGVITLTGGLIKNNGRYAINAAYMTTIYANGVEVYGEVHLNQACKITCLAEDNGITAFKGKTVIGGTSSVNPSHVDWGLFYGGLYIYGNTTGVIVTYKDGDSEYAKQVLPSGTLATRPDAPAATPGYTFGGWNKADGTAWDYASDKVTDNITLYAKWAANTYTITFDTAGGSEIAPITQDYGTVITAPEAPTREGYTFIGWDMEIPKTMPAENITLKARWKDIEKATGEIVMGINKWREFLNTLTFGLFFKDTQTVTINAADNSGTVFVSYLVTDQDLSEAELQSLVFGGYEEPFRIDPNGEYIVYAMLVDESMNITYLRSDRVTLDNVQPVITGIEDGKTCCEAQTVTVAEKYVDTVTVNGTEVTLDENGSFVLSPADGGQRIVVTDKAGNETRVIVTVNDGHTYEWQSENGQYWQKCKFCNHETAKKDIPTINISGADKVCRMQDYKFSFTLPEGATDAAYGYEFIGLGDGPLTPTFEGGMYCGVIKSAAYPAEETSFKLIVSAKTADGFEFSAEKTVAIQNEHSGGTATCTEQATCEICGEKYGDLKPHSYSVKWSTGEASHWHECTECRAKTDEAEHTDTNKDHKCDVCDKVLSECTDTNKDHKCDLCGKALSEHSGGKATCKDKAKCEFCGESYGELNANNHSDLKHFPAVAATKTAEGNIEYWYCEGCGKYYSDKDGTKEIKKADTVTAKLKDDSKSPQTGDTSNLALWIALLFVSGGAAIGTTVVSRKKKYNR